MENVSKDRYEEIPVKDIVYESNRKNGGWGNIEILTESIKSEGLINPPTVARCENDTYRVIAGRRRIRAVLHLKWERVPVRIIDEADEERLEAITLSENVNRQEMNPLDEADLFKKLLDNGTDIKEIALLYDRSISGIHHRIRLCNLHDELKKMFMEGRINLSGAALLAGLPDGDQAKFAKKYSGDKKPRTWDISDFIHKAQSRPIAWIADGQCEKCKNRTNNTETGLFEDFSNLEDVCFDNDCYTGKWKKLIGELIAKKNFPNTENNIMLDRNIPKFLPAKTETVSIGDIEYKLIPFTYSYKETSKKSKKDTAWLVTSPVTSCDVEVKRIEYKIIEHQNGFESSDIVKEYSIDTIPGIAVENQKAAAEKVREKYGGRYSFKNHIMEKLLNKIIDKRIKEKTNENLAAAYIKYKCSGIDKNGKWYEIDPDYAEIFSTIFSPAGISKLADIPGELIVQKIFLFLTAAEINTYDMPDINFTNNEQENYKESLFWKFAQMTLDEYTAMYNEVLSAAVNEAAE
jgi:ParB family chromosome partitioning protein